MNNPKHSVKSLIELENQEIHNKDSLARNEHTLLQVLEHQPIVPLPRNWDLASLHEARRVVYLEARILP